MDLPELRHAASRIFDSALGSVDPGEAVRRAVRLDGSHLAIVDSSFDLAACSDGIYAVAIGKAALPMAIALEDVLGGRLREGLIAGPIVNQPGSSLLNPQRKLSTAWRWYEGGHPLPNNASLLAAEESFGLLARANAVQAPLIFLISGGGSAMIEWPRNEKITLADLRIANRLLVSCGAKIAEINAVRRAYSAVKGGGLAERAPRCDQLTLIISDTNAGDQGTVASGPTIHPPADAPKAAEVVARYPALSNLPPSILAAILGPTAQSQTLAEESAQLRKHYVLLSNRTALEAAAEAARQRGFHTEIAYDVIEQPIAEGCQLLLSRLEKVRRTAQHHETVCLISGGEFGCPVRGDGIGGRNSESVLRCALEIDASSRPEKEQQDPLQHTFVLSAGTDGIDGNSPAAGAFADETTVARARALGLDSKTFLNASNAFPVFAKLGDTVITGPTGTNVRDVRILLASGRGN